MLAGRAVIATWAQTLVSISGHLGPWWHESTGKLLRRVILLETKQDCVSLIPINLQSNILLVHHTTHRVISKTPSTRYTNRHHPIQIIHETSSLDNQPNITMSAPVYTGRLTPQERFSRNIDPRQPEKAMISYQELMYQHTIQQYERVTTCSGNGTPGNIATPPKFLGSDSASTISSLSTVSSASS
jgi:hypothetical protein